MWLERHTLKKKILQQSINSMKIFLGQNWMGDLWVGTMHPWKRFGKNWMHINHCMLMLRFKEGKEKNSKLLNFFLILILNMLRSNIVYLLVKSYHLSVMFMLVFSTLIYNPFHLGMIVRIFLNLDPQDKVEVVLLFEVEDEV